MAAKKDYFGLGRLISLILVIIPFTAWLCGVVTRFQEGKLIAAIIRVFGGAIIWILDIFSMVTKGQIFRLLDC